MAVCRCLAWPDPCLRTAAEAVEAITEEICAIWQDMIDTMEAMPGVGLAAPQIGVMLRRAVVDASQTRGRVIYLANPEIMQSSTENYEHEEASPNLPGVSTRISRPKSVLVRFMNEQGMIDIREFTDLWAISVQHQIDHLNGKMYFDNLSQLRRRMLLKKARKAK